MDLRAGYHHIPLDKPSIPKTALNSPFGRFEYVKVPFGLVQAPAYFQELMTGILKDLKLHNSLSRQHNNIQQNTPGTPFTHQNGLRKTQISKPFHEKEQVQFFLQRNSISRTYPQCYRYQTLTCQDTCHTTYATTNYTKTR